MNVINLGCLKCDESLKTGFKKYFIIKGRARRSEFCFIALVLYMLFMFPWMIFIITKTKIFNEKEMSKGLFYGLLALCIFLTIFFLIPIITAGVRRLHDINKSGWFWFLFIVPFGIFVLIYFFLKDSDKGGNDYGLSPKYPINNIPDNYQNNYLVQPSQPTPMIYSQSTEEPFTNQQCIEMNNNNNEYNNNTPDIINNDMDMDENFYEAPQIKPVENK